MKLRSYTNLIPLPVIKQNKIFATNDQETTHRYNTRSRIINDLSNQFVKIEEPIIDFDDASKKWNKNKKKLGNGMYAYKKFSW